MPTHQRRKSRECGHSAGHLTDIGPILKLRYSRGVELCAETGVQQDHNEPHDRSGETAWLLVPPPDFSVHQMEKLRQGEGREENGKDPGVDRWEPVCGDPCAAKRPE